MESYHERWFVLWTRLLTVQSYRTRSIQQSVTSETYWLSVDQRFTFYQPRLTCFPQADSESFSDTVNRHLLPPVPTAWLALKEGHLSSQDSNMELWQSVYLTKRGFVTLWARLSLWAHTDSKLYTTLPRVQAWVVMPCIESLLFTMHMPVLPWLHLSDLWFDYTPAIIATKRWQYCRGWGGKWLVVG